MVVSAAGTKPAVRPHQKQEAPVQASVSLMGQADSASPRRAGLALGVDGDGSKWPHPRRIT